MLQFKTDRQQSDYDQLGSKNPRLLNLIQALVIYVQLELKKDVVLTDVFRTQEEFDALYAQTPSDRRPKTSPHMRWEAVDLRSSVYTQEEIDKLLKFLNTFTYLGGQKPVALYHTITGNVAHFHIQYEKV